MTSLVPRPFEEEEKGPGTHCTRMHEAYGAFPSIIRGILSLTHGRTRYTCTKHPKLVKPRDSIFLKNVVQQTLFALI